MNFDFSDDQKLLQTATRDYLEDRCGLEVNRSVLEGPDTMSAAIWSGAAEMGWLGAVIPEEYGGAGFGHLELVLIAEEVGRALAPIPFTSSGAVAEAVQIAGSNEQRSRLLPGFADGSRIGALALAGQPWVVGPERLGVVYENGLLSGHKIAVGDGLSANIALVAASSDAGPVLVLAELDSPGVSRTPEESVDPTRQCAVVDFASAPAELLGEPASGWNLLQRILDRAAVVTAFEQVGGAERALHITREQILARYAFGRPIASFQAIKHRMSDLYAAIEIARSNCFYGAWTLANDASDLPLAAATARVGASEAFNLAAQEMIQMHGGVGFTWEYDCHLFYRRAQHLGLALGPVAEWKDKLVDRLAAAA